MRILTVNFIDQHFRVHQQPIELQRLNLKSHPEFEILSEEFSNWVSNNITDEQVLDIWNNITDDKLWTF